MPPREELLEAAITVLAREGLAATTVRAVADEVCVSRTAVYHHFGDRDGLIAAVGGTVLSPLLGKIQDLRAGDDSPSDQLAEYLLFEARLLRLTPVPVIALLTSPELRTPAHAGMQVALDGVSTGVESWVREATGLSAGDCARRTALAGGAILGLLALQPDYPVADLPTIVRLELELLGVESA